MQALAGKPHSDGEIPDRPLSRMSPREGAVPARNRALPDRLAVAVNFAGVKADFSYSGTAHTEAS
jgi:hypothetical protein